MILADNVFSEMIDATARHFTGRVELYNGSTLALMCGCHNYLQDFKVERTGASSLFFGFGICQKMTATLIDKDRELDPKEGMIMEAVFGVESDYIYPFPKFIITSVKRDETTNKLTVEGHDPLYKATDYTYQNLLMMSEGYKIETLIAKIGQKLELPIKFINIDENVLNIVYTGSANFEGTETLRQVLDDIAEVTQSIYYIDWDWHLTFRKLDKDSEPDVEITKDKYFDLTVEPGRELNEIAHITELGDNAYGAGWNIKEIQYIRDNPFYNTRHDVNTLLVNALSQIRGLTITPFTCRWRGNFLTEIGDKLRLTRKDGTTTDTYILNDIITFNGALSQKSEWKYEEGENGTETAPSTIGDVLSKTYAIVDKANKQIDLVVSTVGQYDSDIAQLQLKTDNITASVSSTKEYTDAAVDNLTEEVRTLSNQVSTAMSAEQVQILIQSTLNDGGPQSVTTSTGFTFNDEGLTIDKSDSEISTRITEDGMRVYKENKAMLTASNEGVQAQDLHATTFLIIGSNSRFEDYDNGTRTGCFWIGEWGGGLS